MICAQLRRWRWNLFTFRSEDLLFLSLPACDTLSSLEMVDSHLKAYDRLLDKVLVSCDLVPRFSQALQFFSGGLKYKTTTL